MSWRLLSLAALFCTGLSSAVAQEQFSADPAPSVEQETPAEQTLTQKTPAGTKGQRGMAGMGGPGGGGGPGYFTTWFPSQPVDGRPDEVSIFRQNLSLGFPVWRGEGDMLILNTDLRSTMYNTEVTLPRSGRQIPEQLWSVTVGTIFRHKFENGWSGATLLNVGSSGDKPFNSLKELNGTVLAFLTVPSGEQNSWMFSLFYSPLSEIPFPIPGIAYGWYVDETFQINLGIPFRVMWKPHPDVFVEASYMPVTTVHVQTGWKAFGGPLTIFGGYDWSNEAYQFSDRASHKDRFFSYAMTLSAGLRYDFPKYGTIEVLGGYAFDRFLFIGQGYSDRNQDRLNLGAGPYLGANFRLRF